MSALDKAVAAYGATVPDWIVALARACDAETQGRAARRINYSAATVSFVLNGRYTGDLKAVEDAVRVGLMSSTVPCPATGADILRAECKVWQARPYPTSSAHDAAHWRCCRRCPNGRMGEAA